jgi:hypothetical protein
MDDQDTFTYSNIYKDTHIILIKDTHILLKKDTHTKHYNLEWNGENCKNRIARINRHLFSYSYGSLAFFGHIGASELHLCQKNSSLDAVVLAGVHAPCLAFAVVRLLAAEAPGGRGVAAGAAAGAARAATGRGAARLVTLAAQNHRIRRGRKDQHDADEREGCHLQREAGTGGHNSMLEMVLRLAGFEARSSRCLDTRSGIRATTVYIYTHRGASN